MNASKPILNAYDGSDGAKAAVEAAGGLFPRHAAEIVSVWHSVATAASASLIAIPASVAAGAYEQLDREAERHAIELADGGAAAANEAGLDATGTAVLCRAQVWATIVDAADECDAQAVVVGSRGRSGVASALLGSVANGVVHHSSRPVVVVPARRRRRTPS